MWLLSIFKLCYFRMRLQLIFSHAFALCYFHIGLQFVQIDGVNDNSKFWACSSVVRAGDS